MNSYWQKQSRTEALFPDIEWNKPEQRAKAGKLLVIGGNKLSFVATATAYEEAIALGAGQVRVLLPNALKSALPPTILETVFTASTPSGGMSKNDIGTVNASLSWSDHALLIGDAGRNSETAAVYEHILQSDVPLTITRDAVDLLKQTADTMINRPQTALVVSFAQLQKLFQAVYYPKMLGFSMQASLLVETLHKFTLTYPSAVVTYHQNQLIIACGGDVVSQEFDDPMMIWRGSVATRAACYQMWTPKKQLEAITASIVSI